MGAIGDGSLCHLMIKKRLEIVQTLFINQGTLCQKVTKRTVPSGSLLCSESLSYVNGASN